MKNNSLFIKIYIVVTICSMAIAMVAMNMQRIYIKKLELSSYREYALVEINDKRPYRSGWEYRIKELHQPEAEEDWIYDSDSFEIGQLVLLILYISEDYRESLDITEFDNVNGANYLNEIYR